jgi:hypothetical protein
VISVAEGARAGFTSHGRYLEKLAENIAGYGFCSVLFNYDSYLGIDTAAEALATRLDLIRGPLQLDASLSEALRGVVLLGTPNQGALAQSQGIAGLVVRWLAQTAKLDQPKSHILPGSAPEELGARMSETFDPPALEQEIDPGTPRERPARLAPPGAG